MGADCRASSDLVLRFLHEKREKPFSCISLRISIKIIMHPLTSSTLVANSAYSGAKIQNPQPKAD